MVSETIFFYSRCIQLGSEAYPDSSAFPSLQNGRFFYRKPLAKTCTTCEKERTTFPFVFLSTSKDTCICSCILSSWENRILLNKLLTPGRRFSLSLKRIARAKACSNHRLEVNIFGKLTLEFCASSRSSQRELLWKPLAKFERTDQFQPGKVLKIRESISSHYSISYCKISLFIYCSSLSNAGPFLLLRYQMPL